MPMLDLSSVDNIMTYQFGPQIWRQWSASVVLGSMINTVPGEGKDCSWAVQFTGVNAGVAAEGEDVDETEYTNDIDEDAHESWATYRSAFKLSEQVVDAALSSNGDPSILANLVGDKVITHSARIAKAIEEDLVSGTGTRTVRGSAKKTIVGLLAACEASGTYGGIDPATYPEWAGNVIANGGTARALTGALLQAADRLVFADSGVPSRGKIITTAGVADAYESLWQAKLQVSGIRADIGSSEQAWRGREIVRSADMPTGTLLFLDPSEVEIRFLPFSGMTRQDAVQFMEGVRKAAGTPDMRSFNMTNIPVRICKLGKTGDSFKFEMRTTVQLVVRRRNRLVLIEDIQE